MSNEDEVFDALKYHIVTNEFGSRFYLNSAGELHRTNGPAVEYANGEKWWYQNGQLHRTDGPAVEYADGTKEWCVNGEELSEEEFNRAVKQND